MVGGAKGAEARRALQACAQMEREIGGMYRDLAVAHAADALRALRTAIELEERFDAFHVTGVAVSAAPKEKELFAAMLAADRDHVAALRGELAGRG